MLTLVHVTHEAVHKIGGIGTVLEGLITARPYQARVGRTLLVGPLFSRRGGVESRLGADGEVWYSSVDGKTDHALGGLFRGVKERFGVDVVYGRRRLRAPAGDETADVEVLLFDVGPMHAHAVSLVKFQLYEKYGIASDRFETIWEYEQYVRLAGPALAALKGLGLGQPATPCVVVAHEFMGLPTALLARLDRDARFGAVFHAHETASVRRIVEEHPGHDVTFYNVMRQARRSGQFLVDVFGDQGGYFKHALVAASRHCDHILAVGPLVMEELRFLGPEFDDVPISVVFNGVLAREASPEEVGASKRKLQQYTEALLGYVPDFVFTHVTRLVRSKGLWRDLWLLEDVEQALRRENRTAVMFVLSTELGSPRHGDDVRRMERAWKWPVAHREGFPDLTAGEAGFYTQVQEFNARSRSCKVVFINQFGFDRACCGERMPAAMEFWDIRRGSDMELGQPIYEPFGIAPVEALSFGALCVISSVSGCVEFVREAGGLESPNVVLVDYTRLPEGASDIPALLALTPDARERMERETARRTAAVLLERLPRTPQAKAACVRRGHEIARRMSWSVVAERYILPAIEQALSRQSAEATAV